MTENNKNDSEFRIPNSELKNKPFISIIIPIFNAQRFIRQTLESTLQQTFTDIEIICVDDKSTDDTVAIIKQYALADKRIRLFCHEKNMGTLKARSTGVKAAIGQFILFLDNDDELELFACEELYTIAEQHKADIYGFVAMTIYPNEVAKKTKQGLHRTYYGYLIGLDIFKKCLIDGELSWVIWNKMFASAPCKKAYEHIGDYHVGIDPSPLGEDILAIIATAYFSETYYGVDKPLYKYYYDRGFIGHRQITLKDYDRYCMSAISVGNCRDFFEKQGKAEQFAEIIDALEKGIFDVCFTAFCERVADKDKEEALKIMMHHWHLGDLVKLLGFYAADVKTKARKKRWETPFKLLPKGGRIILYGAGDVGSDYYNQIVDSGFCEIALWVDKNYKTISEPDVKVSAPEEIANTDYDVILIAILDKTVALKIKEYLTDSLNVPEDMIICQD